MTLHTVNKSGTESSTLMTCLRIAAAGDTILLIEDGVYAGLESNAEPILKGVTQIHILALTPDLQARGLVDRLMPGIQQVDYDGFVNLTEEHEKVISWY